MTDDDNRRLVQTLVGVHGFYGAELTEYAIRVWTEDLRGVPIADVEAAFTRHRRDMDRGRWLPKPADILRQLQGDIGEQALVAWGSVIDAARAGGRRFDGPTQMAIDAIGGMARIRLSQESEVGFLRREFIAAFATFRARDEAPERIDVAEVRRIWMAA